MIQERQTNYFSTSPELCTQCGRDVRALGGAWRVGDGQFCCYPCSQPKPRALDLFCGGGGATKGLQQAGYHVTGVDIVRQPHYCGDAFIQADALTFPLDGYDLVWASPTCKRYSTITKTAKTEDTWPDQIPAIRARLHEWGGSYIIENVITAPLENAVMLCGAMFGLKVYRHRLFESNHLLLVPPHVPHWDQTPTAGRGISPKGFICIAGHMNNIEYAKAAMGTPWLKGDALSQAIPPAYSEYLGRQVLEQLARVAA